MVNLKVRLNFLKDIFSENFCINSIIFMIHNYQLFIINDLYIDIFHIFLNIGDQPGSAIHFLYKSIVLIY